MEAGIEEKGGMGNDSHRHKLSRRPVEVWWHYFPTAVVPGPEIVLVTQEVLNKCELNELNGCMVKAAQRAALVMPHPPTLCPEKDSPHPFLWSRRQE